MRVNIFSLWIGLIIFFQLNAFYLLDSNAVPSDDIALILEVLLFAYVYTHKGKNNQKYKAEYSPWFIAVIALAIIAAARATVNYGQPFWLGLRPQRAWVGAMLMYFPINRLIRTERYSIDKMLNTIDLCNVFFMILVIAQYLVADHYMFLTVQNNQRYGSVRLYVQTIFLWISFMRYFCNLLEGTRLRLKDILFIASPIFILFFVTKSRMAMIAFIASILILVSRKKLSTKKLFFVVIAVVVISVFLSSSVGQDLLTLVFSPENSADNTSGIRELGREFYINKLLSSPINMLFGYGFPNMLWPRAVSEAGFLQKIFIVDNGIFGQTFVYGMVYLIWIITLYWKSIRSAAINKCDFVMGALLIGILGSYSLVPHCSQAYIAVPLLLVIIENIDKCRTNNIGGQNGHTYNTRTLE